MATLSELFSFPNVLDLIVVARPIVITRMPFCLSSGGQWVFGVLDSTSMTCTRTSLLDVDVTKESMVKDILTIIVFWVSTITHGVF
jgi:hypothetical protein